MYTVLTYSSRVLLVYFFTYLSTRILTKKAIAEMTAYEMAGLMVLANVAAEPLVDKVLIKTVFGSGFLVLLMLIVSKIALVNRFTKVMEHNASIIIQNGQIDYRKMKSLSLSLNQFFGLLRQQGYDRVSDINLAVFEPSGTLSVFPKAANKPVTQKDMNIKYNEKPVSMPLILDGKIITDNLKYMGISELWLLEELNRQGISDYKKQVFLAELGALQNLTIYKK
jgi:uncharacterized membrane protein YcaP (DUF421 family)